jgi:hypothetical protein
MVMARNSSFGDNVHVAPPSVVDSIPPSAVAAQA